MLGTYLGGPLGGEIGALGGSALAKITGMGDYTIRHNSVMASAGTPAHNASFSSTGSSIIRVRRRECVGQVYAPADPAEFSTTRYRIQASNEQLFPWGAVIAPLFQEYEIKGCVFTMESTYSNYSAAGALGSVAMATQYNAADRPFEDIEAMLNSAFRTSGNPSQTLVHGLECDPKLQASEKLLVRNRANAGVSQAPNNYDFGWLTLATEGLPAAAADAQIGRLYVTYDIEFSLPRLQYDILAIEESQTAAWSTKDGINDVVYESGAIDKYSTTTTPCGTWNYYPSFAPGATGGVQFDGPSINLNAENQLDIGPAGAEKDVVLFEPTTVGNNVPVFTDGDNQKMLAWVCGTIPNPTSRTSHQCHFNFVHGGRVRITFMLTNVKTTKVPVPHEWWVPAHQFQGVDPGDVEWSTSMSDYEIAKGASAARVGSVPNVPTANTGTGGAVPSDVFMANVGVCTISVTVKFQSSAPSRVLSVYSSNQGSGQPDAYTEWGSDISGWLSQFNSPIKRTNGSTRYSISFLK